MMRAAELVPISSCGFRQIFTMFVDILLVLDELVLKLLFKIDAFITRLRQAIYGVYHKVEAI